MMPGLGTKCFSATIASGLRRIPRSVSEGQSHGTQRYYSWLDTGTHDSLIEAASFIATLQRRQSQVVARPEEIAYRKRWIDAAPVLGLAQPLAKDRYGQYLKNILADQVAWPMR
jgi:dTDP-glucose pyrophosphorylase